MELEKSEKVKKFLEGWVSYRNEFTKAWKKCWIVLRGNVIYLFTSNKTNKENMNGTLSLGGETCISDLKSKKGFKFQLSTLNQKHETTTNVFKFAAKDDFQLWKAYIVAIATGTIPKDAHLLPGQRLDLYDAIIEVNRHLSLASGQGTRRSSSPDGPTTNGTPRPRDLSTRIKHSQLDRFENDDEEEEVEDSEARNDPLLRHILQLEKRQEDIAKRDIDGITLTSSTAKILSYSSTPVVEIPSCVSSPLPKIPHSQSTGFLTGQELKGRKSSLDSSQGQEAASPSQRTSFLLSPHPFYLETTGNNNSNSNIPSWFVNCSRSQAEAILTQTKKFGTVLMRANSHFSVTGNYVISYRRELEGKVVVSHYNIVRSTEGFKIDVENQHSAMPCLSRVVDFFLSFAGTTARPLTCNDLTQLLGKHQTAAFPSASSSNEELVEVRSQTSSGNSRQRIDAFSSFPVPTTVGSNRSRSVQSSSGSTGSRTSHVSFDFSSRRTSDPHHSYNHRSSTASSCVFYSGGSVSSAPGLPKSASSASPYSGSMQDSIYNEAVPGSPDLVQCVERGSHVLRETESAPNNLEIYANQFQPTPTGTLGTEVQGRMSNRRESATSHGSSGTGPHIIHASHAPGSSQRTYRSGSSQGAYGLGSPQSTYGPGSSKNTYGSASSQGTNGPGSPQSTYGPGSSKSTYGPGSSQITYGSETSKSTYGSASSQVTNGPGSPPSTYGLGSSKSTYGPGSSQSPYGYGSSQSIRTAQAYNTRQSDSPSTLSTNVYGSKAVTPGQSKIPPPPPPKPSSQEIYAMMKPLRPPEADYGYRSEVIEDDGRSTVEDSNGVKPSVKDLARMLQCAVTLGK